MSIVQVVVKFFGGKFLTSTSACYVPSFSPYSLSFSYYLTFIFMHFKIQAERNYCCECSYLVVVYVCLLQIQIYYCTCSSIVKLIMLLEVINYFCVFCCIHRTEEEIVQTNTYLCEFSIVHYARIFLCSMCCRQKFDEPLVLSKGPHSDRCR